MKMESSLEAIDRSSFIQYKAFMMTCDAYFSSSEYGRITYRYRIDR